SCQDNPAAIACAAHGLALARCCMSDQSLSAVWAAVSLASRRTSSFIEVALRTTVSLNSDTVAGSRHRAISSARRILADSTSCSNASRSDWAISYPRGALDLCRAKAAHRFQLGGWRLLFSFGH